jgi:CheY-like chemotaxis protein
MKTRIVIIEDSYTDRVLFKAVLEELDIEVMEFSSAQKALEVLDSIHPNMILLDMCMPIMTGFEFLRIFRQTNQTIPVLVVSVLDAMEYQSQAYALGANEYLVKPVNSEELVRRISSYIECETIYENKK